MVKFLKLPVLFRQVIYLMNKASLSISLPPSFPHLFCQRSKHAVTPRFCSLICLPYGSVSCGPHSSVQMLLELLFCAKEPLLTTICTVSTMYPWVAVPTGQNYRRGGSLPNHPVLQVYGAYSAGSNPSMLCVWRTTQHPQEGSFYCQQMQRPRRKNVKIWKYFLILTLTHIMTLVSSERLILLVLCGWVLLSR